MKKLAILFFLFNHSALCQINEVKKNLSELFFKVPLSASKFEVRTMLNSDANFFKFSDYKDYSKAISANFKNNFKLSYLPTDKLVVFWFPENSQNTNSRKLTLWYETSELSNCIKQYNEINSIFSKISYKTKEGPIYYDNEQNGVGTKFYASSTTYLSQGYYLRVSYRLVKYSTLPNSTLNDSYELEVELNNGDLK